MGVLCFAAASLVWIAGSADGQIQARDVSPKIVRVLKQRLKPSDLGLSAAKLRAKLNEIGDSTDLFKVAEDESYSDPPEIPMPAVSKVKGSLREAMVVLEPTSESESPRFTYWMGLAHGRIAAFAIPRNADEMIGPIYGAWRRRGKYLVGVGYDKVYHQEKWFDAEIYVLKDTTTVPKIVQRLDIEGLGSPFGFLNPNSLTIDCRQSTGFDYETIQAFRERPSCQKLWEFRGGKYVVTRKIPIHDEFWALDRLMTAAAKHRLSVLNSMIPKLSERKVFEKRLREAIRHEAVYIGFYDEPTLASRRYPGYGIDLDVAKTKTGWVLRHAQIRHFKASRP